MGGEYGPEDSQITRFARWLYKRECLVGRRGGKCAREQPNKAAGGALSCRFDMIHQQLHHREQGQVGRQRCAMEIRGHSLRRNSRCAAAYLTKRQPSAPTPQQIQETQFLSSTPQPCARTWPCPWERRSTRPACMGLTHTTECGFACMHMGIQHIAHPPSCLPSGACRCI